MRKQIKFKLDEKEITAKELTVEEIIGLPEKIGEDTSADALEALLGGLLPQLIDGVKYDELKTLAPSELKTIWQKIKEANEVFFETAQWLELDGLLGEIKRAVMKDLSGLFADFAKQDIAGSGSTDSPSS